MSLLALAAICIVVLLLPWGSPAPKAHADTHRRSVSIGPAPSFAIAARQGVAELLGKGGRSPAAWNSRTGLWGGHTKPNWWQSALAVVTLMRYAERTHDTGPLIQRVLLQIYNRNVYKPFSTAKYDFANEFGDDTAWWGQAWLEASRYELTVRHNLGDATRFLGVAEWDADYIATMPRSCGGIPWAVNRPADAVTSAEFATLAAGLASYRESRGPFYDPPRAAAWLTDAREAIGWLTNKGLINFSTGVVLDAVNAHCQVIGGSMTYTQGEVAEALLQMGVALHQPRYYRAAEPFLRFALNPASQLITQGVLVERCEYRPGGCGRLHFHLDLPAYKGIFVLAASDWDRATRTHVFERFLRAQARAVVTQALVDVDPGAHACARAEACQFGFYWTPVANPSPNTLGPTVGSQESGIDALVAVLPPPGSQAGARRAGPGAHAGAKRVARHRR